MVNGEQQLPDGWKWESVTRIGEVVTGTTPSKAIENYYGDDFPFYKPTDLDAGFFTKSSRDGLSSLGIQKARLLPEKSVLVTCIGATIGKTGLIRAAGASNQQINAIIPNESIIPEYLYYACVSPYFQKSIQDSASATTLPILNKRKFEQLLIPVAPLPEQERIVAKIEELFTQLEAGASALERVRAGLRRYKASVLKAAVEGRLLGNRRVENSGKLPDGWRWVRLDEITENFDGKRVPVKASDRQSMQGEYPYYGASGIIDQVNDYLFEGDYLLIAEDGANLLSRSTPIAFQAHGKFWVNNHAHIVKTLDDMPLAYLELFLNSLDLQFYVTGTAQPKLTQANLNKILVPLPPLEEQRRIVAEVERRLSVAREVESVVEKALVRAARLRQSVLRSAFEGRL